MLKSAFIAIFLAISISAVGQNHGSQLYNKYCATCHGDDLKGGMAQSLINGVWQFGSKDSHIFRNVKYGIPDRGMPGFEDAMTDDEIKDVIFYLQEEEKKAEVKEDAKRKYLEVKAAKYNISPIALGFFGGVYDFNKMSWVLRKTMSAIKPQLEEAGFKETRSGVYDLRNLDSIRDWAKEVAEMID